MYLSCSGGGCSQWRMSVVWDKLLIENNRIGLVRSPRDRIRCCDLCLVCWWPLTMLIKSHASVRYGQEGIVARHSSTAHDIFSCVNYEPRKHDACKCSCLWRAIYLYTLRKCLWSRQAVIPFLNGFFKNWTNLDIPFAWPKTKDFSSEYMY